MRRITKLREKWLFSEGNVKGIGQINLDDGKWQSINIPHDWAIDRPLVLREADIQLSLNMLSDDPKDSYASAQGFYDRWGVGWYRKKLDINLSENQMAYLNFDGIFHESTVYLDGKEIGGMRYGYSAFSVPVNSGVLEVRVDNSPEHAADRWYSGCGIYRPVTLTVCDKLHVKEWGITITADNIEKEHTDVNVKAEIQNEYDFSCSADIKVEIIDPEGAACAQNTLTKQLQANDSTEVDFCLKVDNPKLWDIDNPELYTCRVSIITDNDVIDSIDEKFGIRKVELIPRKGLFLNGRSIKIKGVNLHHDLGAFGAAWNKSIARDRLEALKEIGCNAIRTAHNPPSAEFLDLCDEMGFLVMDESFDKWDTLRYGEIFKQCWKQDIKAMILRDKNHPSIIMWSVGNEVYHQGHNDMIERLKNLTDYARSLDETRPVTFAMEPHCFDSEQMPLSPAQKAKLTQKMHEYTDIIAGNYHEQWYDEYHKLMPDSLILGTETYPFYRGHDNSNEGYLPQNPWLDCNEDYVIGQFIWAGIDYLGEAVGCGGWPVRGWAGGIIDTAGQIKPKAYLTKSLWTDEPMVYMAICDDTIKNPMEPLFWSSPKWAAGWNFEHLGVTAVRMNVFTNCEEVEIVLNGAKVIKRKPEDFTGGFMELFVPWNAGKVEAVGYIGGKQVCRQEYTTAKAASKLNVEAKELGEGIIKVTAKAMDEDGVFCFGYNKKITFSSNESMELLVVDNGDLTDHTPYTDSSRQMQNGMCTAFYKVKDTAEKCLVEVITEDGIEEEIRI